MLQSLRDQTQSTGFKILIGAIIVVLTLFGFGATNLFLGADPELGSVGDYSLTQSALAVETDRERLRILNQMGPDFDPASIDRQQLSQYVAQQVINKQVMYQTAEKLGIQIPESEVNETLLTAPAYQVDGQFNESVYRQVIQQMGYRPQEFVQEFTSALSAEALQAAVNESLAMTDWETAELVRVLNQRRDMAYLVLATDAYLDQVEVSAEEVEIRYDEQPDAFMTAPTADVEYVHLSVEALMEDPSIVVTEEEIAGQYEDERSAALKDEQRDSAHILVQVDADRSEEEALQVINEAAERIAAGEDFATVAAEVSEDPGSATNGGSLGPVGKGIFDPAFEEALWALVEPGDVTEPVRTEFGYHLIRLDEIVEQEYPSLESRREELTAAVRRYKAQELFAEQARELEELAYDEQYGLTDTADALGVELKAVSGFNADTEHELLSRGTLTSTLFSETVIEGANSDAIALNEEEMVVVRVAQYYPPELKPLESVQEEIEALLRSEKANALVQEHKAEGLERLRAGEGAADIAQSLNASWVAIEAATRTPRTVEEAEVPNEVRTLAFELARPTDGNKAVGAVDLLTGAALVTVTRVIQGDMDTTLGSEVDAIRVEAQRRAARIDLQSLLQAAEQVLDVRRPNFAPASS